MELETQTKWFAEATPVNAKGATANIGSGTHGTVAVTYLAGTEGNDYTIEVSDENDGDDDVVMSVELTDTALVVKLGTDPDANSHSSIGFGTNGIVNVEVDPTGVDENEYTIAVVEGTEGANMSAALVSKDITVTLGMTTAVAATAVIGAGANAHVDIVVDVAGAAGNNKTVAVDGTLTAQDRALSAALVGNALTVVLATEGDAQASANIGSGANGVVHAVADAAGSDGNEYTIEVKTTASVNASLAAILTQKAIAVTLGTTPAISATATIGSGQNGVVTASVDAAGVGGNDYTIEVVVGAGENAPLSAVLTGLGGKEISVTLGTDGSGVADAAKNTATLVAAAITALEGVTATASGTGATALTTVVTEKAFTGGNAGGAVSSVKNTATLVAAVIQALTGVSASASGDGTTAFTITEAIKNFTGGTNRLKASSNTATLVATAINNGTDGLTATADGAGGSSLTASETVKSFAGGISITPDAAKNTATLVAAAVGALQGIDATASGTGAASLSVAEQAKTFTSGTDSGTISVTKNTATLIAAAINEIENFTAIASGTGASPIVAAEVEKALTGGQFGTESIDKALLYIGGAYYYCTAPNGERDANWRTLTFTTY